MQYGVDHWKKTNAAWLIAYTTGARPGLFSVLPGYRQGTPIGTNPGAPTRDEDETLR